MDHLEQIEQLLQRVNQGDVDARRELFELTEGQLRNLTRKMLSGFSQVRRWEETDDVWQNVSMRIWKSFEKMTFQSPRHFLNASALQIRRELLTLAEHYRRPSSHAAHHASPPSIESRPMLDAENPTDNVDVLSRWTELHDEVDRLEDEQKEVFQLHWYNGLTHESIAELIGVSERTVKRRWQAARLSLYNAVNFDG